MTRGGEGEGDAEVQSAVEVVARSSGRAGVSARVGQSTGAVQGV